ncbi:tyrosine-type recombinase/integrase [Vibrio alginolyticus]|uniref:tyrosine-type recombinase/integrase n=1 Tax=Vibrio alginolyticus TaxID=663 RepID=UPI0037549FFF
MKKEIKFTENRLSDLKSLSVDKKTRIYDSSLTGFIVTLLKSGKMTYDVYKKPKGGRSPINVRIGVVGLMPLIEARDKARKVLVELQEGRNPNVQFKESNQDGLTLCKALSEYIELKSNQVKPNTLKQYKDAIFNYSPKLVNKKLKDITRQEIAAVHKRISEGECSWVQPYGKTYKMSKPSPSQADLWGRAMKAIFNYAIETWRKSDGGVLIPDNPVKVLSRNKLWNNVSAKNTRLHENQIARFFDTLEIFRSEDNLLPTQLSISKALEVGLFTGLRLNEILSLEKKNIDLENDTFFISRTKNGLPQWLPLTTTIRAIFLERIRAVPAGCKYLFPSRCGTKPISEPKKTIKKLKEISTRNNEPELTLNFHDMRRTFSSLAESLKVGKYIIKRLVNHKSGSGRDVTEDYMHFSPTDLKPHATEIEHFILKLAGRLDSSKSNSERLDEELEIALAKLDETKKRNLLEFLAK